MYVPACLPTPVTWGPDIPLWMSGCPLLLHLSQNLKSFVPQSGMKERRKRRWLCAPLSGAMEGWHGASGPVATVALGQVTSRALTLPEAATYFLPKKKGTGFV